MFRLTSGTGVEGNFPQNWRTRREDKPFGKLRSLVAWLRLLSVSLFKALWVLLCLMGDFSPLVFMHLFLEIRL